MPSHLKDGIKVRPSNVSDLDIEANDKADELARKAADLVQLSKAVTAKFKYVIWLVKQIQLRLASILLWLPAREDKREVKVPKEAATNKMSALLAETEHNIKIRRNRYCCTKCCSNFRVGDPAIRHWLTTKCIKPTREPRSLTVHEPLKVHDVIHIGNQISHVSHDLYSYVGLVYCNKCGAYGAKHFNLLARQCEAPRSAGLRTLKCIANGKLPIGITDWPDLATGD